MFRKQQVFSESEIVFIPNDIQSGTIQSQDRWERLPPLLELQLFGVTACGKSIQLNVHDVELFVYVVLPPDVSLRTAFVDMCRGHCSDADLFDFSIVRRKHGYGYHFDQWHDYLRVSSLSWRLLMDFVKDMREQRMWHDHPIVIYEDAIDPILRVYQHKDRSHGCWIRATRLSDDTRDGHTSQIQVKCKLSDLTYFVPDLSTLGQDKPDAKENPDTKENPDAKESKMPDPLSLGQRRVAVLDVETSTLDPLLGLSQSEHMRVLETARSEFRTDKLESIWRPPSEVRHAAQLLSIQVLVVDEDAGGKPSKFEYFHLTHGKSVNFEGATHRLYSTEGRMLEDFFRLWKQLDVDVVVTHNGNTFDFYYLMMRARVLNLWQDHRCLGKTTRPAYMISCMNKIRTQYLSMPGRLVFDTRIFAELYGTKRMSNFKLKSVAEQYLAKDVENKFSDPVFQLFPRNLVGLKKEMDHQDIVPLWSSELEADRNRLGEYGATDTFVTYFIFKRMSCYELAIVMSRTANCPPQYVLNNGQIKKSLGAVVHEVDPNVFVLNSDTSIVARDNGSFEGALVFTPVPGVYYLPVISLDFSSMYPSIMIDHSVCFGSIVYPHKCTPEQLAHIAKLPHTRERVKGRDVVFVRGAGFVPTMQRRCMANRVTVRAVLKKEKSKPGGGNPVLCSLYDMTQQAIKIHMNGTYGFFGESSPVPNPVRNEDVSATVTTIGRQQNTFTARMATEMFPMTVVMGDTDSTYVFPDYEKLGLKDKSREEIVKEAFRLGREICGRVTKHFRDQGFEATTLSVDKICCPFVIFHQKKNYAYYECDEQGSSKLKVSGMPCVKRSTIQFTSVLTKKCLDMLLINKQDEMKTWVTSELERLASGKVSVQEMTMVRRMKNIVEYKTPVPQHVVIAEREWKNKKIELPYGSGDRLSFLHVSNGPFPQMSVQEFLDVKQSGEYPLLCLDIPQYIESCIENPLMTILQFTWSESRNVLSRTKVMAAANSSGRSMLSGKAVSGTNNFIQCKAADVSSSKKEDSLQFDKAEKSVQKAIHKQVLTPTTFVRGNTVHVHNTPKSKKRKAETFVPPARVILRK